MRNIDFDIFDAHIHTYGTFLEPGMSLIEYMDKYHIKKAILTTINRAATSKIFNADDKEVDSPKVNQDKVARAFERLRGLSPKNQLDHQDVINIANEAPERFYKFFWFNPKVPPELEEENYKILEDHFNIGFCGVKIHSGIHLIEIPRDVERLVSFMQEYNENFPIFIHSTPKTSFFNGILAKDIAKLAQSYPKMKIIVGHAACSMEYAIELGLTLKNFLNVYFETSCSIPYGILSLTRTIGHERIIFGTDAPVTNPINLEIEKVLCLPLSDQQKQDILYNNVTKFLEI